MIRRTKVDPSRVKGLAQTQLAAFKANPGLADNAIALPEEIEARLVKAAAAAAAYELLAEAADKADKAAKAAKAGVQDEMFELREVLKANIDQAAGIYGLSAAEVAEFGGKPRPIGRRAKRVSAPGAVEAGK